jgi:hypothetical protein
MDRTSILICYTSILSFITDLSGLCWHAAELAQDISESWWIPLAEDLAKLREKRQKAGLPPPPDWRTVKKDCRVMAKPRQDHAASLDEVRQVWRQRLDSQGRGVWSAEADAAVDRVIKEILAGLYEGTVHPSCQCEVQPVCGSCLSSPACTQCVHLCVIEYKFIYPNWLTSLSHCQSQLASSRVSTTNAARLLIAGPLLRAPCLQPPLSSC